VLIGRLGLRASVGPGQTEGVREQSHAGVRLPAFVLVVQRRGSFSSSRRETPAETVPGQLARELAEVMRRLWIHAFLCLGNAGAERGRSA